MTFYTYDEQGYLIEEKQIPGFNYVDGEVDSTIQYYRIQNGNRYGFDKLIRPPNTFSTGTFTYQYTALPQLYDLTAFSNSFLGHPNLNLPGSFGYQYIGLGGSYYPYISYYYEMEGNIVTRRTDTYLEDDSIVLKEILNYQYITN